MSRPDQFHRLSDGSAVSVRWREDSPLAGEHRSERGTVTIFHGDLTSGKSACMEICLVDTGAAQIVVLPGRGMGIWRITTAAGPFGWKSPIDGPVHPAYVPLSDPDGLGWLQGFDELVVRCGLESNGAPDKCGGTAVRYPLHGQIANLPAMSLQVEVDPATGGVSLIGEVVESKLFFKRLRLRSRAVFTAGSAAVEIIDQVTNELSTDATAQLLYHINLGSPLLSEGATLVAPIAQLAPKDAHAAEQIDRWNEVGPPQSGYAERVYFARLHSDAEGQSAVLLRGADGERGLGVTIDTRTLPYFILWKNTAAQSDGYVVGLEPATNFPNPRSFEAEQGRVVSLAPGQCVTFRLGLHPLDSAAQVNAFQQRITALADGQAAEISDHPNESWSGG
jgi:hypothetical protein